MAGWGVSGSQLAKGAMGRSDRAAKVSPDPGCQIYSFALSLLVGLLVPPVCFLPLLLSLSPFQ